MRVKFCELVARYEEKRGMSCRITERAPDAWYVQVCVSKRWKALMNLPFQREQDAVRAAQALTAAGLDCQSAMERAGVLAVKQVATEFLQW